MKTRFLFLILSTATLVELASTQTDDALRERDLLRDVDLVINTAGAQSQGVTDAKLAVIQFLDFQCYYCELHARQVLPQVLDEYVKAGRIRYIVLNFPQEKIHVDAEKAAEMGECAAEQAKYWEAHFRLFEDRRGLDTAALEIDQGDFQACLSSGRAAEKVKSQVEEGRRLKMPGTPSFYFGYSDSEDPSKVRAVRLLVGSQTFKVIARQIDSLIEQGTETKPHP